MSKVPVLAALVVALPAVALAEAQHGKIGFYDRTVAQCFTRAYDADHMAAHPKQKVTAIAFMTEPGELITASDGRVMFTYTLKAKMTGIAPVMANPGVCYEGTTPDQIICEAEGDGGVFTLSLQPDGHLKLDNPAYISVINDEAAINGDSDKEFVHILAEDDQANFLLAPATDGLCAPAAPPNPG